MSSAEISEHEPHTASSQPPLSKRTVEPDQPKGSPIRTIVVVVVVLAIVGAAVWKIRSNTENQATQGRRGAGGTGPTPVTVASVEQKTMPIYLTALGTVTAYNTVTIKTRVDGQLIQVPVREGQAVNAGQLLAEIDPGPYQAALAQAQGQLAKDQATADYARVEAARYKDLFDAGVVSKDSAQTQESSAGQSAGAIAADQAAIQAAKVNLAYTKIASPIEGVVGLRQVDPGNIVHAADATGLLVVTQLHPIAVIFTLPEDELPQVQQVMRGSGNLAVEAYDRSNSTHIASGKLLTLDNQIDTTTGMVKAKAVFDNRDNALFPNQFVNVRLILQDRPDAVVVPAAAIQSGAQGNFVFAVKAGQPPASDSDGGGDGGTGGGGGRRARGAGAGAAGAGAGDGQSGPGGGANAAPFYVEAQPVKVDLTEDAQVILASGVKPGDRVVIDGQEKLRNGSRVTPRDVNAPLGGGGGGRNRTGGGKASGTGTGQAGAAQSGGTGNGSKGGTGAKNQSGGSRQ